jgi:tetratricopeptide (TPR) repeat protein
MKKTLKLEKMKNAISTCFTFILFITSTATYAQKDSIAIQREARKLVREGNALYNQNNFTDASVAYKKALEKNSSYKKATYNLGNSLYQEKNYKEAIPQYNITVENAKNDFEKAEGYHNIGNAMLQGKNYKGAVAAFKNALRSNPNDDETRYNLAVAQKLLEDEENKDKDKNKDKKEGDDKDKKDPKKNDDKGDDKKKQDPKKNEKKEQKPQPGKMSPQQIKQLLESLKNEEKKTQKKLNAKKAKGSKVKQEKDW